MLTRWPRCHPHSTSGEQPIRRSSHEVRLPYYAWKPSVAHAHADNNAPSRGAGDDSGWDSPAISSSISVRIRYILAKRQDRLSSGVPVVGLSVTGGGFSCVPGHCLSGRAAPVFAGSVGACRPRGWAPCGVADRLVGWRVVTAGCLLAGQGRRCLATVMGPSLARPRRRSALRLAARHPRRSGTPGGPGGLDLRLGARFPRRSCLSGVRCGWPSGLDLRLAARRRVPHRARRPPAAGRQRIRHSRPACVDAGAHYLEIRRSAARLLSQTAQPLGVTALQTPGPTTRLRPTEFVTTRRIIASSAPITNPRKLCPGKQLQLRHATNYSEHRPRSHAHIHDRQYQFCDQHHPATNWLSFGSRDSSRRVDRRVRVEVFR